MQDEKAVVAWGDEKVKANEGKKEQKKAEKNGKERNGFIIMAGWLSVSRY